MSLNPSFALAHRLCLHTERPQEVDERTMVKSIRPNLPLLPQRKADFIEPMDCAPVPKLIDGPEWVYEILCGPPHKISYVASAVMWRWECGLG